MSGLRDDLVAFLECEDLLHAGVRAYLEREGCSTTGLFRNWVDKTQEWADLLQGKGFEGVQRKHIAHIKERWEQLRVEFQKPPFYVEGASSASAGPSTPSNRPARKRKVKKGGGPEARLDDRPTRSDSRSLFHERLPSNISQASGGEGTCHVLAEAAFWKDLIQIRHQPTAMHAHSVDDLSVMDLCSLTGESDRVETILGRFDQDCDGMIDTSEMQQALDLLGFHVGKEGALRIMGHVLRKPEGAQEQDGQEQMIDAVIFMRMLKCLRLAELFTPSAGVFQWTTSPTSATSQNNAILTVCDFGPEFCFLSEPMNVEGGERFFFGSRRFAAVETQVFQSRSMRWVHFDAIAGMDRLTLLRLAVKYNLHPLAVDDVLDNRTPTKIDRYGKNYVVSVDILHLSRDSVKVEGKEPRRVRIHRTHATLFLPEECNTLVSIHQERSDDSSWLRMWRRGLETEGSGENIFSGLLEDLRTGGHTDIERDLRRSGNAEGAPDGPQDLLETPHGSDGSRGGPPIDRRPIKRMREEAADFLLYEVLHRIVLQFRPITTAYAERLGFMHQKPIDNLSKDRMDEVAEIKLEVYDFVRSIRPVKQMVKHLIDDTTIGDCASMYLEDVDDAIDSTIADLEHLTKMAETLEGAHERLRDNNMNDTLFMLSIMSAIFLPLQTSTGWYGMNFSNMPELVWDYGYQYFLCLQAFFLLTSLTVILTARFGRRSIAELCGSCCSDCFGYLCPRRRVHPSQANYSGSVVADTGTLNPTSSQEGSP